MLLIRLNLFLLMALAACSVACRSAHSQPQPNWTIGFWFWQQPYTRSAPSSMRSNVLFVHVGTLFDGSRGGTEVSAAPDIYAELPSDLPAAEEYWLVFRFEEQRVPRATAVPALQRSVAKLLQTAQRRNLRVRGIQLDIDSPTGSLYQYASFLRVVKAGLPPGCELSITALLDWFRPNTAIKDVIDEVDEFVSQFYDVAQGRFPRGAIGAKVDVKKWGPNFNRFEKRFRIGISTFGRARFIAVSPSSSRDIFYRDPTPADLGRLPDFALQAGRNDAGEVVLDYRAIRETAVSYVRFQPGDTIQFVLPTPESVRLAVESARQIGGYNAGVVFFRWPLPAETLVMPPDETIAAANGHFQEKAATIEQIDAKCASVTCTDLYLVNANRLAPVTLHFRYLLMADKSACIWAAP